jgi:hypothetical protein
MRLAKAYPELVIDENVVPFPEAVVKAIDYLRVYRYHVHHLMREQGTQATDRQHALAALHIAAIDMVLADIEKWEINPLLTARKA